MKRKIKNKNKVRKNTLLLICPELELKNNVYVFKKQKSKKKFNIPAIFMKYLNSSSVSVKIMVNYLKDLNLKKEIISIFLVNVAALLMILAFVFI